MTFQRPVAWRANLIAFSLASAPPLVKKKTSMSPGAIWASFSPSRARGPRAPRLVRHERVGVRQLFRLRLNRRDHAPIAVADVHAHQLRVEVDVALAVGRVEVDALSALDRDGVDGRLRGPLVKRVFARKRDDLV